MDLLSGKLEDAANLCSCKTINRTERPNENNIMLSNTATVPALHGGGITLDTIRRPTDVGNRRTKIICTLGPACWSETNLAALMDAGMNTARFNFSHGDHKGHGEVLERLRKVAAQKARNIGTLRTFGIELRKNWKFVSIF